LGFELSFVVNILAFFDLATFWAILCKILANFFSNHLVTLILTLTEIAAAAAPVPQYLLCT